MIWFLIGWACLSFAFHKKHNEEIVTSILVGLLGSIAAACFIWLMIGAYLTFGWY